MWTQAKRRNRVCLKGTTVAEPGPFLRVSVPSIPLILYLKPWTLVLNLKCTGWELRGPAHCEGSQPGHHPGGACRSSPSVEHLPHMPLKPVAAAIMILLCRRAGKDPGPRPAICWLSECADPVRRETHCQVAGEKSAEGGVAWLGKAHIFPVTCHFPATLRDETLAWASFKFPILPGTKPLARRLQAMEPRPS